MSRNCPDSRPWFCKKRKITWEILLSLLSVLIYTNHLEEIKRDYRRHIKHLLIYILSMYASVSQVNSSNSICVLFIETQMIIKISSCVYMNCNYRYKINLLYFRYFLNLINSECTEAMLQDKKIHKESSKSVRIVIQKSISVLLIFKI